MSEANNQNFPTDLYDLVRERKATEKRTQENVYRLFVDHLIDARKCSVQVVECASRWRTDKIFTPKLDMKIKSSDGRTLHTDEMGVLGASISKALQQIFDVLDTPIDGGGGECAESYILAVMGEDRDGVAKSFSDLRSALIQQKEQMPLFYKEANRSKSRSEHGALTKSLWQIILQYSPHQTLDNPRLFAKAIKLVYDDLNLFDSAIKLNAIEQVYYNSI